ncbi:ISAs1 family transposase [Glycomyces salinus]|uniref:ISAs1 family transposase n=1 Tax=Glycomyces salinus TaxID=980294 RepID=UPI0018EC64B1|nr:ISAs1 family transposase [Glycomyces salinus]
MSGKDLAEVFGVARFEECVAELTGPRGVQGRCYPLAVFVAVALAGLLGGRNTPSQWARWAADAPEAVVRALGGIGLEVGGVSWWSLPSYNRLVEVLSLLDSDELARFASRIVPAEEEAGGAAHVRLDGKRPVTAGRVSGDGSNLILVGALADGGRMADQVIVDDGDEIAALRVLCERLDAEGALVSADALHCNEDTAEAVLNAGADYCLALKGNQPTLFAAAKALVETAVESRETAHGRSETRTVKILSAGGGVALLFPGLAQIARIRRWTRDETTGEETWHVMFYLTSRGATALRPVEFAEAIRGHWGVEAWHWTRDVVFGEDRSTATAGNLTVNLASLRAAAIAILTRLGGNGITAWRDRIGNHPYTAPLAILGIADIRQEFQLCLSRESRGFDHFLDRVAARSVAGLILAGQPRPSRVRLTCQTRSSDAASSTVAHTKSSCSSDGDRGTSGFRVKTERDRVEVDIASANVHVLEMRKSFANGADKTCFFETLACRGGAGRLAWFDGSSGDVPLPAEVAALVAFQEQEVAAGLDQTVSDESLCRHFSPSNMGLAG